ncbi:MAG: NUDIX domain-containing protein [Candidatus Paceibacterota bacterium]|jgi:putative (di)nucleoside polyphosphate hydrolase
MYRKGVSALIINSNDEFLLVNLESFEDKYFAIPGGGVEQGETLENAVYREIHEELGIGRKSLKFVGKSQDPVKFKFKVIKMTRDGKNYEGSERYFFGFRFLGNDDEIHPKEGEVRAYKWISFVQLKDYLLFDDQLKDTQEKIKEIFTDF